MFLRFVIFSARHQLDAWTLAPPEDTWYGVNPWVLRVLGQGLKSECADIFHQSFLWLLRHTDEPQKGRNSCLWLQSRSVLSSFGVVLMSYRVNFHVVRSALQHSACRICLHYYFCWSGLYKVDPTYVLRHIRLRSFAVICGSIAPTICKDSNHSELIS